LLPLSSVSLTDVSSKVHTFYEAVGYMISAQPNKPQQEKLIAKLMELPNNAVCIFVIVKNLTLTFIN
jgi:hypothetical protein